MAEYLNVLKLGSALTEQHFIDYCYVALSLDRIGYEFPGGERMNGFLIQCTIP
jgi:hypothetical protein